MKLPAIILLGLLSLTRSKAQQSQPQSAISVKVTNNVVAGYTAKACVNGNKHQEVGRNDRIHLSADDLCDPFKKKTSQANSSIGITYLSNYHKNVPSFEQTIDDNIHYRSYIQTTSGAIFYYDEIVRIGRRN